MPAAFSIVSGESTLVFERVGETYVPRVYLGQYQEAASPGSTGVSPSQGGGMAMEGAHFITLWAGDVESPARITRVSGQDVLEFEGEFPGLPDWRLMGNVMAAGDLAPRNDWQVRLVYLGDDVAECRLRVRFEVRDTCIPRWMVPAMFYKHNRPENCVRRYPGYSYTESNPEEFVSSYWAFRSDRSSCPSVFCWTDNLTTCLTTP